MLLTAVALSGLYLLLSIYVVGCLQPEINNMCERVKNAYTEAERLGLRESVKHARRTLVIMRVMQIAVGLQLIVIGFSIKYL